MEIPTGTIVSIAPTRVWIESDFMGDRFVVMQHEGCEPFTYATFHYDYAYTSNAGTLQAATDLALSLGAKSPVEHRSRPTVGLLGALKRMLPDAGRKG